MIAGIRMTLRIHHRFGSHAQEMLGIRFLSTQNGHSIIRKLEKRRSKKAKLKCQNKLKCKDKLKCEVDLKGRPHLASSDKPQRISRESPSDQQLTLEDPSHYRD